MAESPDRRSPKEQVYIYIDVDDRDHIQQLASAEGLGFSAYMRRIMRQHLNEMAGNK